MFDLFAGRRHKEFAADLVRKLSKDLPPDRVLVDRKSMTVNKITRMLEKTFAAVTAYQKQQRLGMVRRAMLANNFKWELTDAGYPQEFVDMATECFVIELTRASGLSA